jgi:hypothetical protein
MGQRGEMKLSADVKLPSGSRLESQLKPPVSDLTVVGVPPDATGRDLDWPATGRPIAVLEDDAEGRGRGEGGHSRHARRLDTGKSFRDPDSQDEHAFLHALIAYAAMYLSRESWPPH